MSLTHIAIKMLSIKPMPAAPLTPIEVRTMTPSQARSRSGALQSDLRDASTASARADHAASPDPSPIRVMIAQEIGFRRDCSTERNTHCISEGEEFLLDSRDKRARVNSVMDPGSNRAGDDLARVRFLRESAAYLGLDWRCITPPSRS